MIDDPSTRRAEVPSPTGMKHATEHTTRLSVDYVPMSYPWD